MPDVQAMHAGRAAAVARRHAADDAAVEAFRAWLRDEARAWRAYQLTGDEPARQHWRAIWALAPPLPPDDAFRRARGDESLLAYGA